MVRQSEDFKVHILTLKNSSPALERAEDLYQRLQEQGIKVLLDDRDMFCGAKLCEADSMDIPIRVCIGPLHLRGDQEQEVEVWFRKNGKAQSMRQFPMEEAVEKIVDSLNQAEEQK